MKLYLIALKLFIIAALLLISNHSLALYDAHSREVFVQQYHDWLSTTFDRGLTVAGYVVKSEWLPETSNSSTSAPLSLPQR